ncbi:hypothetical protein [Rhodophyticola porphyridii]|uniref:Uncharacterized protein n=1 Tax=Rhodophyticola porphyridii TaxID=1852017 RepID=A0A3L9Y788_9RHOB|nr:hypothetical protein [Rhodophyticola porphyridii]RMA42947.1 hypothetical protein D9R08_04670 [Rhodophyticola porphyridii]
MTGLTLIGFQDSVYTRAVRLAPSEKALAYEYDEANPFTEDGQASPAGRDDSRADRPLASMIGYFALVSEGRAMLEARSAPSRWFAGISARAAFAETRPGVVAVLEGGR